MASKKQHGNSCHISFCYMFGKFATAAAKLHGVSPIFSSVRYMYVSRGLAGHSHIHFRSLYPNFLICTRFLVNPLACTRTCGSMGSLMVLRAASITRSKITAAIFADTKKLDFFILTQKILKVSEIAKGARPVLELITPHHFQPHGSKNDSG